MKGHGSVTHAQVPAGAKGWPDAYPVFTTPHRALNASALKAAHSLLAAHPSPKGSSSNKQAANTAEPKWLATSSPVPALRL